MRNFWHLIGLDWVCFLPFAGKHRSRTVRNPFYIDNCLCTIIIEMETIILCTPGVPVIYTFGDTNFKDKSHFSKRYKIHQKRVIKFLLSNKTFHGLNFHFTTSWKFLGLKKVIIKVIDIRWWKKKEELLHDFMTK